MHAYSISSSTHTCTCTYTYNSSIYYFIYNLYNVIHIAGRPRLSPRRSSAPPQISKRALKQTLDLSMISQHEA